MWLCMSTVATHLLCYIKIWLRNEIKQCAGGWLSSAKWSHSLRSQHPKKTVNPGISDPSLLISTLCTDHSPTLDFHYRLTARPLSCSHFHSSHLGGYWTSSPISIIYAVITLALSPFFPRKWARFSLSCVDLFFFLFLIIHNCLRVYKFVSMNACSCVCAGGSQLNKQTLSLEKLSGCLKHLASIQGTLQFCVFNSQLCNCLHHTCCTQKGGGWGWGGKKMEKGKRRLERKRQHETETET